MAKDTFTLFSTARISLDEYTDWLHQLNAVITPDSPEDARLSKDVRHVWISLLDEEWFDMTLAEFADQPEVLAKICQLLGGEPQSAIVLIANGVRGSKILAVQFAALCAEHYPCVVLQTVGNVVYSREKLFKYRDAGMGFDGFTWETAERGHSFSWDDLTPTEALSGPVSGIVALLLWQWISWIKRKHHIPYFNNFPILPIR
jgi:hypothetical protein